MAHYEYQCRDGHISNRIVPIRQWKPAIRCQECGKKAEQVFRPSWMSSTFPVTTVFILEDGKISIPGRANVPTPDGAKRIELHSIRQVEAFEKKLTHELNSKDADKRDLQMEAFSSYMSERRKELRDLSRHWTPQQREFADKAIEFGNEKDRHLRMNRMGRQSYYLQALHHDKPNRECWRDVDTDWKEKW